MALVQSDRWSEVSQPPPPGSFQSHIRALYTTPVIGYCMLCCKTLSCSRWQNHTRRFTTSTVLGLHPSRPQGTGSSYDRTHIQPWYAFLFYSTNHLAPPRHSHPCPCPPLQQTANACPSHWSTISRHSASPLARPPRLTSFFFAYRTPFDG